MKLISLDLNEERTEKEIVACLKSEVGFGGVGADDLDALCEILSSKIEDNYCVEFTGCRESGGAMAQLSEELWQVLESAAQTIDEREGKRYAVFADTRPVESIRGW